MGEPVGQRYQKSSNLNSIDMPSDFPSHFDESDKYFQMTPADGISSSVIDQRGIVIPIHSEIKNPIITMTDNIETYQNTLAHNTSSSSLKGNKQQIEVFSTEQNGTNTFSRELIQNQQMNKSKRIISIEMRNRLKNRNHLAQKNSSSVSQGSIKEMLGESSIKSNVINYSRSNFRKNSKHNSIGFQLNSPESLENHHLNAKRGISSSQHLTPPHEYIQSNLTNPTLNNNLILKVPINSNATSQLSQHQRLSKQQIINNPATAVTSTANSPKQQTNSIERKTSDSITQVILQTIKGCISCFIKKKNMNKISPLNKNNSTREVSPPHLTLAASQTTNHIVQERAHGSNQHSFFQLAGQLMHNSQLIMPSSPITHGSSQGINQSTPSPIIPLTSAQIPEINPGISWNFVKKLAKVKKFIDSIKTSSLYQSFYKINITHLELIADKSDFTILKESFQKNQKNEQQRLLTEDLLPFVSPLNSDTKSSLSWIDEIIPLFLPHQPLLNWFKVIMLVISLITLVLVPLLGSFQIDIERKFPIFYIIFALPFVFFVFEILVNMNTAYYEEGDIQMSRRRIFKQYAKSQGIIDIISTLGCYFLFVESNKLSLCLIMLRILKLSNYRREINEYFYIQQRSNTAYTLVNLIATVVFVAHYFACGFNYIAFLEESIYEKDSWVITLSIDPLDQMSRYINSIYFSFITMVTVGFGDIKPTTDSEKVYVTLVALISSLIFAYTVNTIGTVFQEIAQQEAEYKSQKYHLSVYMRSRGINQQLQTRVMKYLDHMIHKELESPQKGQEILKKMSRKIRDEIYKDFFGNILLDSKMFKFNFSEGFLKDLTLIMKEIICRPGEIIYSANEIDNRIFLINKGFVQLFLEKHKKKDEQDNYSYDVLSKGDIFGELSFFTSKIRETSAKSLSISHLIYCNYEDFIQVLKQFPRDFEKFCQMKDEVMHYGEQLNTRCAVCQKFRHSIVDCPYIHMNMRRHNVIHRHVRSIPNDRNSDHNRRREIKSNTLSDSTQTRAILRKVRKDYVAKCMKQEKEENLLIDDTKAGYHISLKRYNNLIEGEASSTSSKSMREEEIKKISDKKFYLNTPKIFLSIDNQITLNNIINGENDEEEEDESDQEDLEEEEDDDDEDEQFEYELSNEDEFDNEENEIKIQHFEEIDDEDKDELDKENPSYQNELKLSMNGRVNYKADDLIEVQESEREGLVDQSFHPNDDVLTRRERTQFLTLKKSNQYNEYIKSDGQNKSNTIKKYNSSQKMKPDSISQKKFGFKKSVTLKNDGIAQTITKKRLSLSVSDDLNKLGYVNNINNNTQNTVNNYKPIRKMNSLLKQAHSKQTEKPSLFQVNFNPEVQYSSNPPKRYPSLKESKNQQKESKYGTRDNLLYAEQQNGVIHQETENPGNYEYLLAKDQHQLNDHSHYQIQDQIQNQGESNKDYKAQNKLIFRGGIFSLKIAGISSNHRIKDIYSKQRQENTNLNDGDDEQQIDFSVSSNSDMDSFDKKYIKNDESSINNSPHSPCKTNQIDLSQKIESMGIIRIPEPGDYSEDALLTRSKSPSHQIRFQSNLISKRKEQKLVLEKDTALVQVEPKVPILCIPEIKPQDGSQSLSPLASGAQKKRNSASKKCVYSPKNNQFSGNLETEILNHARIKNEKKRQLASNFMPKEQQEQSNNQGNHFLRIPTLKHGEYQSILQSEVEQKDNQKQNYPFRRKNTKNGDNSSKQNSIQFDTNLNTQGQSLNNNQFLTIPQQNQFPQKGQILQNSIFTGSFQSTINNGSQQPAFVRKQSNVNQFSDVSSNWKNGSNQQSINYHAQISTSQIPHPTQVQQFQQVSQPQANFTIPQQVLILPTHINSTLQQQHLISSNNYKKQQTIGQQQLPLSQLNVQNSQIQSNGALISSPNNSGNQISSLTNVTIPQNLALNQQMQQYTPLMNSLNPRLTSILLQQPVTAEMQKLFEEQQHQIMHEQQQKQNNDEFQNQQEYQNQHMLFLYDFDRAKEFTNYFPHNNYSIVCKEKKKNVNRRSYFTKKMLGVSTRNLLTKQSQPMVAIVSPRGAGISGNLGISGPNIFNMGSSFRGAQITSQMLSSTKLLVSPSSSSPKNYSIQLPTSNRSNKLIQATNNLRLKRATESLLITKRDSILKNMKSSVRASQILPSQHQTQPLDCSSSPSGSKSGGHNTIFNPTQNSMILRSTEPDLKNLIPQECIDQQDNIFIKRKSSIEFQETLANQEDLNQNNMLKNKSDIILDEKNLDSSILIVGQVRQTFLNNNL